MKRGAALVAQEAVDLAAVVAVRGVDGRERVPLDARRLQELEAADHLVERAAAALVDPVGVVQLARPVDRDPDQEVVLLEERRPLLVEQRAVGLDRVDGPLAGLEVPVRELDRAAEELEPIIVGSPPCQATITSGTLACASISCRTYSSSSSSAIRNREPG